jgi:hypothetical protein
MSIEKKSLISTLKTTKKANVAAKPEGAKADHTVSTRKVAVSTRKLGVSTRKLGVSTRKLGVSTRKLGVSTRKIVE